MHVNRETIFEQQESLSQMIHIKWNHRLLDTYLQKMEWKNDSVRPSTIRKQGLIITGITEGYILLVKL